jgi:uncharacterized membrane protein
MAKEKTQVSYLFVFNLIIASLLLLSTSSSYMSFSSSFDLAYHSVTYHFRHEGDPSVLRESYDTFSTVLCSQAKTESELAPLLQLCEQLDVFKKAGIVCLICTAGSFICLLYVTAYLFTIAVQSQCASSFKPDIAHILLLFMHSATFAGPFLISDFFTWHESGQSTWKSGLTVLCVIWVLIVLSGVYLVWLLRSVIPVLERGIAEKYQEAIRPLAVPLLSPRPIFKLDPEGVQS